MDKHRQYDQILQALVNQRFVSGSELAPRLGLSRTAINRRVNELQAMGTPVNAIPGKGYHLDDSVSLLRDYYPAMPDDVYYTRRIITQSTNDDIVARAALKPEPCLVTTEYQQGGRGRRGNVWAGALGRDLAVSAGFPIESADGIPPYSLIAGILTATVLRDQFGITEVRLKWPNDLWVAGLKMGGILTELHTFQGVPYVVVGVGLNVNQRSNAVSGRETVSLRQVLGRSLDRNELLVSVSGPLCALRHGHGLNDWHNKWQSFDMLRGRTIRFTQGIQELSGLCHGIDSRGYLLIEQRNGVVSYAGGVTNVRPC